MNVVWVTSFYNSAHLIPVFFSHLEKLNPQPFLYFFTENNSKDKTTKLLEQFPHPKEILHFKFPKNIVQQTNGEYPLATIRQAILDRLRKLTVEVGLDYAIFCDSDVFVQTPEAIEILTEYDLDIVASLVPRIFPEGLFISAKWKHPFINEVYQLRRIINGIFDDTPEMVGFGLVCISKKVIIDERINFYPLLPSLTKNRVTGNDFGYCIKAKQQGYKICLEGLVETEHVIYDYHHEIKPWTVGGNKPFEFSM